MHVFGITGGIGSGKSHICSKFREMGVAIFECDSVAKEIMVTNSASKELITMTLGKESYFPDGTLNTKYLASKVFVDDGFYMRMLESYVHPFVIERIEEEKLKNHEMLLIEMATLFEAGWDKYVDKTIWVDAPLEVRARRVMKRDGISREEFDKRVSFQNPDNKYKADHIIINDDEKFNLKEKISKFKIIKKPK